MANNLREKTINGIFWSATEKYGNQFIRVIISIVLARLLEPYQFGLIGMITIFVAISQVFVNSGLGIALIQKKNPTDIDFSTVFYFNLLVAIILYLALFFSASLIANFYDESQLVNITRVFGIILIINAIGYIHDIKIQKSLEFKKIAKVTYISSITSGIIALGFALNGFGVWSLVFYQLASRLVRTFFLWIFDNWKPLLKFDLKAFKELFSYSSKLLASGLLNRVFDNIYNVVIGKFYNATTLGFYDRAKKLQTLAARSLNATIQIVTFPVLSEIQDQQQRLEKNYKKILEMIAFLIFPLMIMLVVIAKPLILVLLGEKWSQVIIYFQLLAIVGIGYPIASINLNILKVKGRSDLFLKLEVIKQIIRIIVLVISIRWGVIGIVIGQVLLSIIGYFVNTYYSGTFINLGSFKQIQLMFPYAFIALIAAGFSYLFTFITKSYYILLPVQILSFITSFLLINDIFKTNAYYEAKIIFKNTLLPKLKKKYGK